MLAAVFSDSHGYMTTMREAVLLHKPDIVFHLGDRERDADALRREFPELTVCSVCGNCDLAPQEPEKRCFTYGGVRVFMCHGHLYHVKYGMEALMNAAGFQDAQLVLFGHTHAAYLKELEGVTFLNPGAAGRGGSFALVEFRDGHLRCRIERL